MKRRILSHRGCWIGGLPKNSKDALGRSFSTGFGIETDIRDHSQNLVISHDPPRGGEMTFSDLLDLADSERSDSTSRHILALNIKADGLATSIQDLLSRYPRLDAFVFDMAVPDMRSYLELKVPVFTRLSEVEQSPVWADMCQGIWLDAFASNWYDQDMIEKWLLAGKRVCVVSPELHRRPHEDVWRMLRPYSSHEGLLLCTDFPNEAFQFFEGGRIES